ncbi:MAG: helix-turn-helix domain-containing protein [Gammaproteobacteria bacterium]|nr:helix-turn-helix domain-containing protein [Gammaproteobacteria bacterium]
MNRLSEILKILLRRRKLTVSELSRHTGIVQPVIYRMTTGESDNPKLASLLPIANYFNVNISQLIGEEPLETDDNAAQQKTTAIPLLTWDNAHTYKTVIPKQQKNIMAMGLSEEAFALIMADTSMEPMFQRGSLLIFDPLLEPQDRSFVLVTLEVTQTAVFRQLIIDANQQYLKPLNPDFNLFKMRLLDKKDTIIAGLVESRNYHNNQAIEGEQP